MQNKGKENELTDESVGKKVKSDDIFDLWMDKSEAEVSTEWVILCL